MLNLKGELRSGGATAIAKPTAVVTPIATKSGPAIKKPDTKTTADTNKEVKKVVKGGADNKKAPTPEEPNLSQETVEDRTAEIFRTEGCTGLSSNNCNKDNKLLKQ